MNTPQLLAKQGRKIFFFLTAHGDVLISHHYHHILIQEGIKGNLNKKYFEMVPHRVLLKIVSHTESKWAII